MNWMAYQNAAKSDFDDWNQPGWTFDELLPAIKKVAVLSRVRVQEW